MHQFIALYRQPEDEGAFMQHYTDVHTPLVRKIPGLQSLQVTRLKRNPMGGAPEFFLMAVMTYPDADTFKAAMTSPENAAAGRDLMSFAKGTVTLMTGETLL